MTNTIRLGSAHRSERTYYTLLVYERGLWGIQFGDFDRDVVEQERRDSYPRSRAMIIASAPDQAEIDAVVAQMNGGA